MSCSQWSPPSTKHMVLQSCRALGKGMLSEMYSNKTHIENALDLRAQNNPKSTRSIEIAKVFMAHPPAIPAD